MLPVLLLLGGLTGCGQDRPAATLASDEASSDPSPTAATTSADPTASPTPDPTSGPSADRFPDDLALDSGLDQAAASSDFRLEGPGRDLDGVPMTDFCDPDPTTWPGPVSDRMAVRETGPEYEQSREVLLYASAEAARAALVGLRDVVGSCPEVLFRPGKKSREDRLHLLLEPTTSRRPAGPDVLTVGVHWRGVLGSGIYQVRRSGRTLVAARDMAEGSVDSLPVDARRMTAGLDDLLAVIADDLP